MYCECPASIPLGFDIAYRVAKKQMEKGEDGMYTYIARTPRNTNTSNKHSAKRLAALIICAVFVLSILLSAAFAYLHYNHDHDHNGDNGSCSICLHISAIESLLKQLSNVVLTAAAAGIGLFAVFCMSVPKHSRFEISTPVALKVRVNN